MTYSPAVESRLSKPQIYSVAESAAQQLNFSVGGDLYELVERMGGTVQIEDTLLTDPEHTGSLYVDSASKFRIVVPSHTSPERDRFTIAHEIGHYLLHYLLARKRNPSLSEQVVAYRRGSERIEWEANWFAAAFLMPGAAFKAVFEKNSGDLRAVADHFKVSNAAAEVRAKGLGLL